MHCTPRLGLIVAAGLAFSLFACSGGDGGGGVDNGTQDSDAAAAAPNSPGSDPAPTGNPPAAGGGDSDASAPPAEPDPDAGEPADGGPTKDGGHAGGGGAGDGGGNGDGAALLNGCGPTQFAAHDESAANAPRVIMFANGAKPAPYAPPCMRIAKGQTVTWRGNFVAFPLAAKGGTTPSPIPATNTGKTVAVPFPAAGTYGFASPAAPTVMLGAIDVTP